MPMRVVAWGSGRADLGVGDAVGGRLGRPARWDELLGPFPNLGGDDELPPQLDLVDRALDGFYEWSNRLAYREDRQRQGQTPGRTAERDYTSRNTKVSDPGASSPYDFEHDGVRDHGAGGRDTGPAGVAPGRT